jgi:hypothetical protein
MGTVTGQNLIDRANDIVQDTTNIRWPVAELLRWLNDGQREIVLFRPDACVTTQAVQLVANSTKQDLPALGIRLLDVTRNMGAAGSTPGRAIRLVSREVLDSQVPDWHSSTAAAEVKHYIFDPKVPKVFWVYPRPATAFYIEVQFSSAPTDLVSAASTIVLDDVYSNALLDYMLYRAYSKDAEFAQNGGLASAHYQAFQNSLGIRTQADMAVNPNAKLGRDQQA